MSWLHHNGMFITIPLQVPKHTSTQWVKHYSMHSALYSKSTLELRSITYHMVSHGSWVELCGWLSPSLLQACLDPSGEGSAIRVLCLHSALFSTSIRSTRKSSMLYFTTSIHLFSVFPYSVVHVRLTPRFSWHNPPLLGVVHAQTISTWPPTLCPWWLCTEIIYLFGTVTYLTGHVNQTQRVIHYWHHTMPHIGLRIVFMYA